MEMRPRFRRPCPLAEQEGCDWWQVTEWFVGGPDATMEALPAQLEAEAVAHLMDAHAARFPKLIVDLGGR